MNDRPIKRLLLVVEDNPGDARLLREMVAEKDSATTQVTHVESMLEAELHLADRIVDVILLDLGLPDAIGVEAVRRAHAAAPNVPLVVITGSDDELLASEALQAGAQDYLIKGQIDGRALLRALRYAIERKIMENARKASENQLLQAQKLESIGRLAGGIAHDFNNMLFAIHGYAELLTQDLDATGRDSLDPEALLSSVRGISQAAERATALTAQLLAFSHQQVINLKVLDMNAAVSTIEPMVRQLIGEQMHLVLRLDEAAGHIRADDGQIDQIIVNLVVNARDAMPDGGTVTIESGNAEFDDYSVPGHVEMRPGRYVFLAVSDTGVGMDAATRDHVFEPFFTTKEVGKGTGLGLATTYGIVHQAGGHIFVYSEPGRGSSFKLYFPRADAIAEARPTMRTRRLTGTGMVMVVEDEPTVRHMTSRLLERAGFDVRAVADGASAIATAATGEPITVLVTDVVMPNLSGIDLAEQMMDSYPEIGVVLLSGYTAETLDLKRVIARGATFVAKPVSSNMLLQSVLQAVESRRAAAIPVE